MLSSLLSIFSMKFKDVGTSHPQRAYSAKQNEPFTKGSQSSSALVTEIIQVDQKQPVTLMTEL